MLLVLVKDGINVKHVDMSAVGEKLADSILHDRKFSVEMHKVCLRFAAWLCAWCWCSHVFAFCRRGCKGWRAM